jgi:hypothetical protein
MADAFTALAVARKNMTKQKLRVLLYLLSAAALCGSIGWFVVKPDWEPGIGILTSLAGVVALLLSDRGSAITEEQNGAFRSDSMPRLAQQSGVPAQAEDSPTGPVPSEFTPRWIQPLTVTFADGVRCKFGMSASYHIQRENAAELVATFGSSAGVEAYIKNRVESAALAVMERFTSAEARRSRVSLQEAIIESVRSQISEAGLLLHSVTLGEITPAG